MSRWIEREEQEQSGSSIGDGLSRGGGSERPRTDQQVPEAPDFGSNRREPVRLIDRTVQVRPSEREALSVLGKFRVVDAEDLVRTTYRGDRPRAESDLQWLRQQKLIRAVSLRDAGKPVRLLTLTRDGYSVAHRDASGDQRLYWGYVKPAEAVHDSHLFRAWDHEQTRLADERRKLRRIVLDYELKRDYFRKLNSPETRGTQRERQAEAARAVHLPVIDGHVRFPDFRIEYEDDRGYPGRVDIEVASDNYRDHHVATKASAGFRVYGSQGVARRFGVSEGRLGGGHFVSERSAVLLL